MKYLSKVLPSLMGLVCAVLSVHAQHIVGDTLTEVVVTGTGTQHLLRDAPVQTEIISRKVLDNFGGKSIEEILGGLTASFAFAQGDMGSQMQMGGLGNSYVLILIDGKRIHGDVGGENDLGVIDPHNIDHIEIVKGAQSALYGSDAIAGVVNIITKRHITEGLNVENTSRFGSHCDIRQHDGLALKIKKITSYTNLQLQHTDGWQNTPNEFAEATVISDSKNKTVNKFSNWQVAQRFSFAPSKSLQIQADGTFYIKNIYRPRNGRHPSCDVHTYNLMYNNASASIGAKWQSPRANLFSFDASWNKHAYFYRYTATTLSDGFDPLGHFTNYFPYFAGQKSLQSDQQRFMVNSKAILSLPHGNMLSVGADFRYDYLEAPMRTSTGSASDWTAALYVQDEANVTSWLNITAGLRLNQNENFGFHITPKVSSMLSFGNWRFRLGWSQGFKSPTTKELHYRYLHVMGSSSYFNLGNKKLNAQSSNYFSAGGEYRGTVFSMSVTAYVNKLDNMIALVNVPVSQIPVGVTSAYFGDGSTAIIARQYMNMEDARTHGVDVNVGLNVSKAFSLGANYSYLDTKAHEYNASKDCLQRVVINGMAHHKWNAFASWSRRFAKAYRLSANLSTRGSSKRFYQNDGNGKAFQLWRLNTSHDLTPDKSKVACRVDLGVDNIFDFVDRTMRPYHLGTNSPGRTFFAALSVKFDMGKKFKFNKSFNTKLSDDED